MKYLAILKDSLREALDTKVLYFMWGLSALVILFVAGMSFVPKSPENGIQVIISQFPGTMATFAGPASLHYDLENFEPPNDSSKPWEGEYRFHVVVRSADNISDNETEEAGGDKKPEK